MHLYEEVEYKGKRIKPSNLWHQALANWLAQAMGDIYDDEEKLPTCYSSSRQNEHDEKEYPHIICDYIGQFSNKEKPVIPFIIYGPPAIGKTTYLSYLLKIVLPQKYNLNIYPIFFDLRNVATFDYLSEKFIESVEKELSKSGLLNIKKTKNSDEDLKTYIEMFKEKLAMQFIGFDPNNYSNVFQNNDLKERIKRTIEERYLTNPKLSCIKKVNYLTMQKNIEIVFIIDNFDHHDKYEDMHQSVYDLAKEILVDFGKPVFLPMRNYTLLDSYDRYGFIEADKARTKSLSAPIHLKIFEKRSIYILEHIDERMKIALGKGIKFDIQPELIKQELKLVISGIMTNSEIVKFLEGISGENMRAYLDLILNGLQSGHLEYSVKSDGTGILTYKSFLKACSNCNNFLFIPTEKRTPILNIYDNMEEVGKTNSLVRIRILQFLRDASSPVLTEDVVKELGFLGYKEESILQALKKFRSSGLIDEIPYYTASKKIYSNQKFEITSIGKFYLEQLMTDPTYFELMSTSCNLPLYYKVYLEKVVNNQAETKENRHNRYQALLEVLHCFEKCEGEERKVAKKDSVNMNKYDFISPKIKSALDAAFYSG